MNGPHRESLDVISLIATIVPPIWVAYQLVTGDRATRILYLIVLIAVAAFYWLIILPQFTHMESDSEYPDDSAALKDLESQNKKISPLFMTAIAGAYVVVLILIAFAGSFVSK